jgi:hypothetical protein
MDITFPVSGVHTFIWLPPLVAFAVSFFTVMVGLSGAFLLLPFQMSVLGFASPAASGTNLIFNIFAAPGGILGFLREKRMVWPVGWVIIAGSIPGSIIGGIVRLHWLLDAGHFRKFVGLVLLYVGVRLLLGPWRKHDTKNLRPDTGDFPAFEVKSVRCSWRRISYNFRDRDYGCNLPSLLGLSLFVGILGGTYGIGGGAIIAPFLIAVYGLPVHTIAGATLIGTFATSVTGAAFYEVAAPFYPGIQVRPDWMLGILFGIGGLCGTYAGARTQRFVSSLWLKLLLAVMILLISANYVAFR